MNPINACFPRLAPATVHTPIAATPARHYASATPQPARARGCGSSLLCSVRNLLARHLSFLPGSSDRLNSLARDQLQYLAQPDLSPEQVRRSMHQLNRDFKRLEDLGKSTTSHAQQLSQLATKWNMAQLKAAVQDSSMLSRNSRDTLASSQLLDQYSIREMQQSLDELPVISGKEVPSSATARAWACLIDRCARDDAGNNHCASNVRWYRLQQHLNAWTPAQLATVLAQTSTATLDRLAPTTKGQTVTPDVGKAANAEQQRRASQALETVVGHCKAAAESDPVFILSKLNQALKALEYMQGWKEHLPGLWHSSLVDAVLAIRKTLYAQTNASPAALNALARLAGRVGVFMGWNELISNQHTAWKIASVRAGNTLEGLLCQPQVQAEKLVPALRQVADNDELLALYPKMMGTSHTQMLNPFSMPHAARQAARAHLPILQLLADELEQLPPGEARSICHQPLLALVKNIIAELKGVPASKPQTAADPARIQHAVAQLAQADAVAHTNSVARKR